jgi:hypothetical protein
MNVTSANSKTVFKILDTAPISIWLIAYDGFIVNSHHENFTQNMKLYFSLIFKYLVFHFQKLTTFVVARIHILC